MVGIGGPGITREADVGGGGWRRGWSWVGGKVHGWGRGQRKGGLI